MLIKNKRNIVNKSIYLNAFIIKRCSYSVNFKITKLHLINIKGPVLLKGLLYLGLLIFFDYIYSFEPLFWEWIFNFFFMHKEIPQIEEIPQVYKNINEVELFDDSFIPEYTNFNYSNSSIGTILFWGIVIIATHLLK